jgi:hypothetical protein
MTIVDSVHAHHQRIGIKHHPACPACCPHPGGQKRAVRVDPGVARRRRVRWRKLKRLGMAEYCYRQADAMLKERDK